MKNNNKKKWNNDNEIIIIIIIWNEIIEINNEMKWNEIMK